MPNKTDKKQKETYQTRADVVTHPFSLSRKKQHGAWLQLITLEYSKAADRYENIYRAIWQNFSYMAVLSAAILTFGAKTLETPFLMFVALFPLMFWFLATFLPMDVYGERTRGRLAEIEAELNDIYFPTIGDPRLSHYIHFRAQRKDESFTPPWRVKTAVKVFGVVVTVACLGAITTAVVQRRFLLSSENGPLIATITRDSATVAIHATQPKAMQDSLMEMSRRAVHVELLVGAALRKLDSVSAEIRALPRN